MLTYRDFWNVRVWKRHDPDIIGTVIRAYLGPHGTRLEVRWDRGGVTVNDLHTLVVDPDAGLFPNVRGEP